MTIPPVRPTGRAIVTDAGHRRGTMAVMAGTAHGMTPGMHRGTILGMIRGTILATMAGRHPGAMAGTAATTIVLGATIAGILLFIIVVAAPIDQQLTTASTPIVM